MKILTCVTVAQTVDPLAGGAGWVGAGLLGLVLFWLLLKHLPDKDRQLKEFQTSKDELLSALSDRYERKLSLVVASYEKELADTRREFREALKEIIEHCKEENIRLIDTVHSEKGRPKT